MYLCLIGINDFRVCLLKKYKNMYLINVFSANYETIDLAISMTYCLAKGLFSHPNLISIALNAAKTIDLSIQTMSDQS